MEKPKYQHDCSDCVHLGSYAGCDLYVCQGNIAIDTSVIARYGSEGGQYSSGAISLLVPHFNSMGANNPLKEAFYRAWMAGMDRAKS